MGSVRRGLILAVMMPGVAWAEVCDKQRPDWDGVPEDSVGEAVALFSSAPSLFLLLCTALVIRFRSAKGGLVVMLLWTGLVSLLAFKAPDEIRQVGLEEGCIGSPSLFIAIVAAICVAMILYTARYAGRTD